MIKKNTTIISIFLLLVFIGFTAHDALAQNQSILKFTIGGGGGGGGGDDGLGPGEFEIPFRCDLDYWSATYGPIPGHPNGHSPYSVDINRGSGNADHGDPVLASADGTVVDIYNPTNTVTIRHEGNYYTSYTHMQKLLVSKNQRVRLGQKIGEIGDVGAPGQYHLHVNHSKNGWYESDRIQVCYKRYGCNPASVPVNDRGRQGTNYNKGCL